MKEVLIRTSVRLPSFAREDLKAIRGMLASHKIERNDGHPVSKEQAITICIKFAYDNMVQMSRKTFNDEIRSINKFVMDTFEKESVDAK